MMTQSASIQCAYDFADHDDWKRKFLATSYLAPLATALAVSSMLIVASISLVIFLIGRKIGGRTQ